MSTVEVKPPFAQYNGLDGQPLEYGYLYIGTENLDPITNPITVYWDSALSITAAQPIRLISGYPSNNGTAGAIYTDRKYSIKTKNKNGVIVFSAMTENGVVSSGLITTVPTFSMISSALSTMAIGQQFSLLGHTVQGVGGGIFDVVSSAGLTADSGTTVINGATAAVRQINGHVTPAMFGGQRNLADESSYINLAATHCASKHRWLDLTGQTSWNIKSRIILTSVRCILISFGNEIHVDVTGTYTNQYAVEIGDPTLGPFLGRSSGTILAGGMCVIASSRSVARKGVYLKGAWLEIGQIRADGFNGTGIYVEDVWDSVITRLSAELCGNTTDYALVISSVSDTTNASDFLSVQCEQSYHKGIKINVIRSVVHNIHSERTYILSLADGASMGYLNHDILLGNSQLDQAIFHCETINAPDGTPIVATTMNIILAGDGCEYSNVVASGNSVYCNYGVSCGFKNLNCLNFYQSSPSSRVVYDGGIITGICTASTDIQLNNVSIAEFKPAFNAENINVYSGSIATLNFANNIKGSITFDNVSIVTVGDTKSPAANYKPTTFSNCQIATFNGSFNSEAKLIGGRVEVCSLASQSKAIFVDVDFGSFTYTGNSAFLTRSCRGPTASTWTQPLSVNFPAGTVTERVGYNAAGKFYQNTDSALTWVVLS